VKKKTEKALIIDPDAWPERPFLRPSRALRATKNIRIIEEYVRVHCTIM
jgi:hypothetical protein